MQQFHEIFSIKDNDRVKAKFPPQTLLIPQHLDEKTIREQLAQSRNPSLDSLAQAVGNSLRYVTDLSHRELGGHIVEESGQYAIASFSLGNENAATREASRFTYHTHTGTPAEIQKLLDEDDWHRDMPSDVDIIDFGTDPNRQAEMLIGPYYSVILQREAEGFSYLNGISKIQQALQRTGSYYAQLEALSAVRGENVIALWIAIRMLHRYFKDTHTGGEFNKNTWLDFVRKCGLRVTIEPANLNINPSEESLSESEAMPTGTFPPILDPVFESWMKQRVAGGLEFLQKEADRQSRS